MASAGAARITSYNVCYTKLLRIETAIQFANQDKNPFVVISVGLDRFKEINNSLGHDQGDDLLINIANRLTKLISQYRGFRNNFV